MGMYDALIELKNVMSATETILDDQELTAEKADEILTALAPKLDKSLDNWKEQIDARIDLIEYLAVQEKKLAIDVEYFQKRKKAAEMLQKRLKEQTKLFMEANQDISFQGTRKRFAIQKNGGKDPVEWKVQLQEVKNVIDPNDVAKFPEEFVEKVQMYALKRDAFDALIASGGKVPDVLNVLERGTHVRIK
jgi:hypothetical protein